MTSGSRGLLLLLATAPGSLAASAQTDVTLNNGVRMPIVSLGTAEFNNSELIDAIIGAVGMGMGVDTAFNYYNQASVGEALRTVNRSDVFVTTKTSPCFHPQAPPKYNISDAEACKAQTRKDVQSDFDQLGIETIDLLLLHGANHFGEGVCGPESCALNAAQWSVYEDFLKAGKVRAIGVSNFCQSCLDCLLNAAQVVPAVNQVKYHPGMTADPEGLLSYCHHHGITPMAYSPLSGVIGNPLLDAIAQSHKKTSAQVALNWIASKGYALATATSSPEHIVEDVDLFSWNLTAEEIVQIDSYSNGTDVPSWACTAAADQTLLI